MHYLDFVGNSMSQQMPIRLSRHALSACFDNLVLSLKYGMLYFLMLKGNSYGVFKAHITICPQINLGVMYRLLLTE